MTALVALAEAAGSGGGLTALGVIVGRVTRRPRSPKPPKQICSCFHGRGMHNGEGCHYSEAKRFLVEDNTTYTTDGYGSKMPSKKAEKYEVRDLRCDCKKYDGPIPAEEFILGTYT